jgi:hypothetical protein
MLLELFWRRDDMTTWQFNLLLLQQVIKNPIALSNIKCVAHFVLSAFRSWLQARVLLALIKRQFHAPTCRVNV